MFLSTYFLLSKKDAIQAWNDYISIFSDGSLIAKVKDPTMKKTLLLLAATLTLTAGAVHGELASQNFSFHVSDEAVQPTNETSFRLGSSSNAGLAGHGSDFAPGLNKAGGASFAQLNGNSRSMPFTSAGLFMLAVAVLFWRVFDVRRAKALADNEHHINRSREQMYRSLYKHD